MNILLIPSNDIKPIDRLDGTRTLARCKQGLRLWQSGIYDFVILSGGQVYPSKLQSRPMADIMYDWLIAQPDAPPKSKILRASTSRDTYEDISNSLHLVYAALPGQKIGSVSVCTDWLHGIRFRTSFARGFGIKNVTIENVKYRLPLTYFILGLLFTLFPLFDPKGKSLLVKLVRRQRTQRA